MYIRKGKKSVFFKEKRTLKNRILFVYNGFRKEELKKKMHLIVNWIDNLVYEEVYHKNADLDYEGLKDIVIEANLNRLK